MSCKSANRSSPYSSEKVQTDCLQQRIEIYRTVVDFFGFKLVVLGLVPQVQDLKALQGCDTR
jgi:hypothetical protein